MHPVTAPVAIGNVVVVYTADAGQLTLRAIDPASGATLWTHPATTAESTPGQEFSVTWLGNTVFYYVAVGDPTTGKAEISAVDATTGKPEWTTTQGVTYADMPSLCSDKAALCDSAYAGDDQSQEIRTDLATGAQSLLSSSASRNLGIGVWDAGDRAPEHIEHLDEVTGRTVWKDDVAQLFEQTVSSDNGWDFSSFGDVYVGWLGTRFSSRRRHSHGRPYRPAHRRHSGRRRRAVVAASWTVWLPGAGGERPGSAIRRPLCGDRQRHPRR